ncbi:hypothetical protein Atai01_78320 [Amycolatopsis taiwanensis]|uniref:Uncharacterized protein n=1 Tax=Amycolatopsis taiwanensis TaxID=342230 RepID=A0A9W6VGV2_9PSEU|nr:hypothetical protein Atai01_78320 [Amycolatopsis taiwanensis]
MAGGFAACGKCVVAGGDGAESPLQTAESPLQTAVSPLQTAEFPLQTAVSPLQTAVSPLQAAVFPLRSACPRFRTQVRRPVGGCDGPGGMSRNVAGVTLHSVPVVPKPELKFLNRGHARLNLELACPNRELACPNRELACLDRGHGRCWRVPGSGG